MEERFIEAIRARGYSGSVTRGVNQRGVRVGIQFGNGDFMITVNALTDESCAAMLAAADSLRGMRVEEADANPVVGNRFIAV